MSNLKKLFTKKLQLFLVVNIGILLLLLIFAWQLAPWLYAINTRVRLHLDAPAETKINICWNEAQNECLPLVPYIEADKRIATSGEKANIWLSELPPRPIYYISIKFKDGIRKAIIKELELHSDVILWGFIQGGGVQNKNFTVNQLDAQNVTYLLRDDVYYLESNPGGQLTITKQVETGPPNVNNQTRIVVVWSLLLSIYLLFAIPFYLVPFAVQNLGAAIRNTRLPNYPWWVYLFCGVAMVLMPLLVVNSAVLIDDGDPLAYLLWATQEEWITVARPPGYQIFLALALWASGYQLNGVILLHAIFLVLSTTICIWMLRKWLHPLVAVLFMFLILFSPSQVYWARWILRDSLFSGLLLLAIATVIAHFTTSHKLMSKIWLALFSIICGLAFLIRENGILLPVVLLPVLLLEAIKHLKSSDVIWKRVQAVFLLFTRYVPSVLIVMTIYLGLCTYNYLNYGYFQATIHVTSHHLLWQAVGTATFDSRSLLEPNLTTNETAKAYIGQQLYRSFIAAREKGRSQDPIYTALFPTINEKMSEKQPVNLFVSASILEEIGRSSKALVPLKADLGGALRQYRELLVQNPSDIGGYSLLADDVTTIASKQKILDLLPKKVEYKAKLPAPNSIIDQYYHITKGYPWYRLLIFLALFSSLYVLRYEDPVFLAPMVFYIANDFLLLFMRTVNNRYVMSLDVLLILQIALGLSCLIYRHFSVSKKEIIAEDSPIKT